MTLLKNPICERERRAGARSARFSVFILAADGVLALIALVPVWFILRRTAETGTLRYASFLTVFRYLSWVEFAIICAVVPALTAGAISGERERRTLDLMLTTRMTPADIVLGKLLTVTVQTALLVFTAAPVFSAVLMFGGVRFPDLLALYLLLILTAVLAGCIGIACSAFHAGTAISVAQAYGAEALLFLGPFLAGAMIRGISGGAGPAGAFLPFSPVASFSAALGLMTGEGSQIASLPGGGAAGLVSPGALVVRGTILQLAMCIVLTCLAVLGTGRGMQNKTHSGVFMS